MSIFYDDDSTPLKASIYKENNMNELLKISNNNAEQHQTVKTQTNFYFKEK